MKIVNKNFPSNNSYFSEIQGNVFVVEDAIYVAISNCQIGWEYKSDSIKSIYEYLEKNYTPFIAIKSKDFPTLNPFYCLVIQEAGDEYYALLSFIAGDIFTSKFEIYRDGRIENIQLIG